MAGRFRSEVTRSDGSSVAIVVDPPDLTADQHATAQAILDEHVQRAADATGMRPDDVAAWFAIELTERTTDAAAYQREAVRPHDAGCSPR
mgnify:FL=1